MASLPNSLNEAKVAAIAAIRPATNVGEVRSLLGMLSYYRRFVRDFSAIPAPLTNLLAKGVEFVWGPEQQAALDELKQVLTTEGKALKRVDPDQAVILYCDWSKQGIGAVLAQVDGNGREHICVCISRSLNKHDRQYVSYKGIACLRLGLSDLTQQSVGSRFYHHHRPPAAAVVDGQQGSDRSVCQVGHDYEFHIVHRKGSAHNNADVLSRMPRADTTDVSGARLDVDPPVDQPFACFCALISVSPFELVSVDSSAGKARYGLQVYVILQLGNFQIQCCCVMLHRPRRPSTLVFTPGFCQQVPLLPWPTVFRWVVHCARLASSRMCLTLCLLTCP
jgi:hypothetical protein